MNGQRAWCRVVLALCCAAGSAAGSAAEKDAALTVRWSAPAVDRPEKISLLPIDVALPDGVTRTYAIRNWTRAITGTEVRWESLPPGTYLIVVRAANIESGRDAPSEVAEVMLAPGDDRTVSVTLPPVVPGNAEPTPRTLRILIGEDPGSTDKPRVSRWRYGVRTEAAALQQQTPGGLLLTLPESCVAGSVVMIESTTGVGTASLDGGCDAPIRVRMAPRADLFAHISVPHGAHVPRFGSLRFARCAGDVSSVDIPFTVSEGRIRTSAPAGCGEMTLFTSGFVPVRPSAARLMAAETRDLGTIALSDAAAAVLRVRAGRDAIPLEGVRVTAIRVNDLATMKGALDVEALALGSTLTDASGWARLTELPEARLIFLLQGRGRKHPQISEPYELEGGEETVIPDLVLDEPSNLLVTLSVPPELARTLELSAVELDGAGHTHWPSRVPLRATLTPAGALVEDIPPGTWVVRASGRVKDGFALRVAETTVDVEAGTDRQVTLTLTDILFHGRVTRQGHAVTGTINLKPVDLGNNRRNAVAKIRGDGEFQVLLEEKGDYVVSVQDSGRRSNVTLNRYVTFDDPDDEVEIELPAGHEIRGRVVDSAGSPIGEGSVTAAQQIAEPAGAVGARISGDGSFVLDGVVPGRWTLIAESRDARSEPLTVVVGDGDADGLTLVLDPVRSITVRVVDVTGRALPMVSVGTEFLTPGAVQPQYYGALTRAAGEAEFRLSRTQRATVTNLVLHSLPDGRLSCDLRRLDSDQTIQVGSQGGEVRMITPRWVRNGEARNWLVASSGCAVRFFAAVEEQSDDRQAMVFRNLAPGRWSYVQTHTVEQLTAILTGRGASLPPITTFVVEPGKATTVDIPQH